MTTLEKLRYLLDREKITLDQIAPEYRTQLESVEDTEEDVVSPSAAL